jgi:type I restriction enzyme, S subunit
MGGEWEFVELERLIEPERGISYGIVQPGPPVNDGVPIVRVSDVRNGRITTADPLRVSPAVEAGYSRTRLKGGELLLTLVGTVGEAAVVPESLAGWNTARAVAVIPVRKDIGAYWVKLALLEPAVQHIIESRLNTTVQATLNLRDVAQLPIVLPPQTERRAIAFILGTLDHKIELNRRMNETLEATARALFKSWFVDFDPVRAKAEGRDPGLPREIADLFPARLMDSQLGETPEGWKVIPLPEAIEVNPTRSLRTGEVAPYLDMANMPTQCHTPDTVIGRAFGSGMRFVNGDTLLARITPCLENGKTAYVDFLEDGQVGWGSTEYIVMRPKPPLPEEFAYCLARSDGFREFAIQSMTGSSGRQRVPAESLSHYLLAAAPKEIANRFGALVRPFFARAASAARESRSLAALRDALLPKLISGALRVKDAERLLGEASQ